MGISWKAPAGAATVLLLAGCTTYYPYETAFNVCDDQVGACYRYCEQYEDIPGDYAACHSDCEAEANQCFANAYRRNTYAYSSYGYSPYDPWPWYGRYGYWYPSSGFVFSFDYYNRYGYRGRYYDYYNHRRRRDGGGRHHNYGGGGGGGSTPPPSGGSGGGWSQDPPPSSPPPPTQGSSSPPPPPPPTSSPPSGWEGGRQNTPAKRKTPRNQQDTENQWDK